ncbi:MAG: putative metal-binding motif-containing protein [Deltaproteobacteria bacterium]|nr:putative metal-binding motif-containing protein [Deltaproteobacteria bacterium]
MSLLRLSCRTCWSGWVVPWVLIVAGGCGWSTALDDYSGFLPRDGSVDGSVRDTSPRRDLGTCTTNADCDDRLFCNGAEVCNGGRCTDGPVVSCEDGDSCTADRCDEGSRGCVSELLDRDSDGWPDARCGGGDCTDSNPSIYPGAIEGCQDGVDFDCNGLSGCADPACVFTPRCSGCPGDPGRMEECFNGVDDNADCLVDCIDPACSGIPECFGSCPEVELMPVVGAAVLSGDTTFSPQRLSGSCGGNEAPEIAVGWTAPFTGEFVFDTVGSGYDTLLYLQDSFCGGPELPGACNDDTFGTQSRVSAFLFEGQRIVVVLDGFGTGRGFVQLNISAGGTTSEAGQCFDGFDNDGDGLFDCEDPDCFGECGMPCMPFELCFDGRDNDCDGLWDCDDEECASSPDCCRPRPERCGNGRDDDCDFQIDCADPDCFGTPRCGDPPPPVDAGVMDGGGVCSSRELGVAMCTNRADDDCDGRGDCSDADCSPFGAMGECCNGLDDDDDGMIDLFTCRCFDDSTCVGVGSLEQICWTRTFSVCAPRCEFVGGDSFCREFLGPDQVCRDGECVPIDGDEPTPPPRP